MPDPTIDLLRNLIAIDSVNPSLATGAVGETEIGTYIANELRASGVDVEIQPVGVRRYLQRFAQARKALPPPEQDDYER